MLPQAQAPWITSRRPGYRDGPAAVRNTTIFPARLSAAERLPVEFDVEPLGGEEALLLGDEIVEPHALGGDGNVPQVRVSQGHGVVLPSTCRFELVNLYRREQLSNCTAWLTAEQVYLVILAENNVAVGR